jgi:hypothetical protein
MAIDDNDITDDSDNNNTQNETPITQTSPNAPAFLKDIAAKNNTPPIDMDYKFDPNNPYPLDGKDIGTINDTYTTPDGTEEKPGFFQTAKAEYESLAPTFHAGHALFEKYEEPSAKDDPIPLGWTPKSNIENFVNIRDENLSYVLDATGPKDQAFRMQQVLEDQANQDTLDNGSFSAKLVGGLASFIDPTSLIPIAGWAKYGKLGEGFLLNATRALPGSAAYGVISAGAEQADKINGNMADFATDAFTRTAFSAVLFAAGGLISSSAEHMNLWNARNVSKDFFNGAKHNLVMDEEGKITGIKVTNPEGNLSAAMVDRAQDLANSTFAQSGLFKIPAAIFNAPGVKPIIDRIADLPGVTSVAEAIKKSAYTLYKYAGSELPLLLSSTNSAVSSFIDHLVDHSILTQGVKEGGTAPTRWSFLMQRTFAKISDLQNQMNALHLESNGFSIGNRFARSTADIGLNLYSKGLKILSKEAGDKPYRSREDFDDQVQRVVVTKQASENASINEAANLIRGHLDETYKAYRKAYNLPEDWMPTKTAEGYLMRVYNTHYMNSNLDSWTKVIINYLREGDQTIKDHLQPIKDMESTISSKQSDHEKLINQTNITDKQVKDSANELMAMKARKKALEDNLSNELRSNPDLQLHVDDWNALSANEAKELKAVTKKRDIAQKEVDERTKLVAGIKAEAKKRESAAMKSKSVKSAKGNVRKSETGKLTLPEEEAKLREVQKELDDENQSLQEKMQKGEINPRLYYKVKDSYRYEFKDANDRLKFRQTYDEQAAQDGIYDEEGIHKYREEHANAYYKTIMNQTPEETINQVMGKYTGEKSTNALKQRTLLVPDELLYNNKFLTNDLMSKVSNYTTYLDRRTHMKNVFKQIGHDDGIEAIISDARNIYNKQHEDLNANKTALQEKLSNPDLSTKDQKDIQKQISSVERRINSNTNRFNSEVESMNYLYSKAMGIRKWTKGQERARSLVMALTSAMTLPLVPITQITDLSAIALKVGTWPMVRDSLYPAIQSMFGLLKTKESQAFRNTAPSIHLALQDVINAHEARNFGFETNPYLNMGRWVDYAQKLSHVSANITGTNYIDNILQKMSGAAIQSELMRCLFAFKKGNISDKDDLYLRKLGIDPKKWADRMTDAFEKDGGGKTTLGGYQSLHYQWGDLQAANEFGDAIFKGIKEIQLQKGIADSPFWTDSPLGSIISGFSGWGYASVNRYVIPTMQQPDAQKLLGIAVMMGSGYLVDPLRRMSRGDDPFPENMTDDQIFWATINNTPIFSQAANLLSDGNLLTGGHLLGDLRSDKYVDRTRAGLLGPTWGQGNRLLDVFIAGASGEWNKNDLNKAARMIPILNSFWLQGLDKKVIDGTTYPENRREAHALKEINQ